MDRKIKEVIYYWYDHLFVRQFDKIVDLIETSIKEHDYNTFIGFQTMLNNMQDDNGRVIEFLPNYATVYYEDNPEDPVFEDLTEELFNLISDCEYECG